MTMSLQSLLACTMLELKKLKKKNKRQPRFYRVNFMASTAKYAKKDALVRAGMRLFKKNTSQMCTHRSTDAK